MSINKTAIVTEFGGHYVKGSQNEKRLISALRQKTVTTLHAKPIVTPDTVYQFSNVVLGEVIQAFQKKFTAKGDVEFKPNKIQLYNLKTDLALYPDDVKASWLGFLAGMEEQERAKWPIVRYMLENEIAQQKAHDMETKVYWGGQYVEPVDGTPGAAIDSMDGLKTIIDTGMTGDMQTVTLSQGAITKANIFDAVEEFPDNFDPEVKNVKMKLYMSPTLKKWYKQDKRNTHGADVNYKENNDMIDFTQVEIVGLPSMEGSNYMFATPEGNYLHCRRKPSKNLDKQPRVEESKREVFFMDDWWEGLGFGYDPLVYVYKWTNP